MNRFGGVPTAMLLSLGFRPERRSSSCYELAAVLEDLEALYAAVPKAASAEEPVQRHILAEHRSRADEALGLPDSALAEVEYRVRALNRLEELGADRRTTELLRAAVQGLAESEAQRAHEGRRLAPPDAAPAAGQPLEVRRVSMASPLALIVSIPFEYWAGPSFLLFLAALERRFNMVGRIRTEKADLAARRAERRADEREAQVREKAAEQTLVRLREQGPDYESPLLRGLEPGQQQFELRTAELMPDADPEAPEE